MEASTTPVQDPRLSRLKALVAILAIIGWVTGAILVGVMLGWLPVPTSWSPWFPLAVIQTVIWTSTLGTVIGAGGGILAVRQGQSARFFALATALIFVVFASVMYWMAFVFD